MPTRKSIKSDEANVKIKGTAARVFLNMKAGDLTEYNQVDSRVRSKIDHSNRWFEAMATEEELRRLRTGPQQASFTERNKIVIKLERLIVRRLQHAWCHKLYKSGSTAFTPSDFLEKPSPPMLAKCSALIPQLKYTAIERHVSLLKAGAVAHQYASVDVLGFRIWRVQEEQTAKQMSQAYNAALETASDHSAAKESHKKVQVELSLK